MSANGCAKVYRSGSLSLSIYCLLVMLLATVAYGQDTPGQAEKAAAPGDILGTLVDSETNKPISGATVTVNTSPPETAITDAQGKFSFSNVPVPDNGQRTYSLTIEVKDGDPYETTNVPVTVACSSTVTVTIKLETASMLGEISGRVLFFGKGLYGVQPNIHLFKDGVKIETTQPAGEGEFHFKDLEPGMYAVGLEEYNYSGVYTLFGCFAEGVQVDANRITYMSFSPKVYNTRYVVDSDTIAPISGAKVRIYGQDGESWADGNGKFTIEVETSGNNLLFVTAEGYIPGIVFFDPSPESAEDLPVNIGLSPVEDPSLPAPGVIAGKIATANVAFPGPGTTEYKAYLSKDGAVIDTVVPNDFDHFTFSVQPGAYKVEVMDANGTIVRTGNNMYDFETATVVSGEIEYVNFEARPSTHYWGSVYNSNTGAPINGATVTDKTSDNSSTTGPDGKWSVPISNPGNYDFVVSKEGFTASLYSLNITVDNIDYPPSLGIVPLPEGQPAPGTIEGFVASNRQDMKTTDVTLELLQDGTLYLQTAPSPGGCYIFSVDPGEYSLRIVPPVPPSVEPIQTQNNIVVASSENYLYNFRFTAPFIGYVVNPSNVLIPGANLTFQPGNNQFTSDADGKFQFDAWDSNTPDTDTPDTYTYDCYISAEGYQPKTIIFPLSVIDTNYAPVIQLDPQIEGNGGVILNLRDFNGGDVDPDFLGGCTISGGFDGFSNGTALCGSFPVTEPKLFEIRRDGIVCRVYNVPAKASVTPIDVPIDLGDFGETEWKGRAILTIESSLPAMDVQGLLRMKTTAAIPLVQLGNQKISGTAEIEYIKGAEYFMGDDPGQGNGTPMEAVDGTFDGEIEDIITMIETARWEAGLKFIFMRVQYSDDTWSLIQTIGIFHEPVTLESPVNLTVTDVEDDNGHSLKLDWELSPDDALVTSYRIYRSRSSQANYGSGFDFYDSIEEVIEAELTSTIIVGAVPAGVTTFTDENICVPGAEYFYWIQAQGENAVSKLASPGMITDIEKTPLQFIVSKPYPNPFNPSVTIAYTLPERRMLSVVIYDILGRKIRVLDNTIREAGSYRLRWDGLDENGLRAGSGIYLYQLRAGEFTQQGKMLLLR